MASKASLAKPVYSTPSEDAVARLVAERYDLARPLSRKRRMRAPTASRRRTYTRLFAKNRFPLFRSPL